VPSLHAVVAFTLLVDDCERGQHGKDTTFQTNTCLSICTRRMNFESAGPRPAARNKFFKCTSAPRVPAPGPQRGRLRHGVWHPQKQQSATEAAQCLWRRSGGGDRAQSFALGDALRTAATAAQFACSFAVPTNDNLGAPQQRAMHEAGVGSCVSCSITHLSLLCHGGW
jgi:hypothetical protein